MQVFMLCPFYRYIDKRAAYALPPEILTYGDIFYISVPVPIFSQFNFSDAFIVLVVKIYYLISIVNIFKAICLLILFILFVLVRSKLDRETNIELVETMWKQFSNLGIYELNVIDTTTHSIKDTVSAVQEKIASKRTTLVEESELTHVAAPDNPTKEFENRQERFALYRAMQQLDAETREVIHLRLAGDFSFRDIGDILGHSEVWARVRFYRGKEKLVKIIGGDNNA